MVLTKGAAKAAFFHILNNVIGRPNATNLKKALDYAGIDDIIQLNTLSDHAIDDLQYQDNTNTSKLTNIRLGNKMILKSFLNFVSIRHNDGSPIGDDWMTITQTEFDAFRADRKYHSYTRPVSQFPSAPVISTITHDPCIPDDPDVPAVNNSHNDDPSDTWLSNDAKSNCSNT